MNYRTDQPTYSVQRGLLAISAVAVVGRVAWELLAPLLPLLLVLLVLMAIFGFVLRRD